MLESGKRIVVKVGTSTLTHKTGKTNIARIAKLVSVLSDLKNAGHQIILVSSGAIAIGMSRLRLEERPKEAKKLQAAAAVGQSELMFLYDKLFSEYDVVVSQLLFTTDALAREESRGHLIDTFNQILEFDCVPVINENDSVSIEELFYGDNDCLSATVATITNADLLIMLTDTDGLYDSNPSENPDAQLISYVEKIDDNIRNIAGGAGSKGTGGFATKVKAAEIATSAGIPVVIMNGSKPTDIYHVLDGRRVGTYFERVK